nr:hypothetical protein [Anaerolineae bacterium]
LNKERTASRDVYSRLAVQDDWLSWAFVHLTMTTSSPGYSALGAASGQSVPRPYSGRGINIICGPTIVVFKTELFLFSCACLRSASSMIEAARLSAFLGNPNMTFSSCHYNYNVHLDQMIQQKESVVIPQRG